MGRMHNNSRISIAPRVVTSEALAAGHFTALKLVYIIVSSAVSATVHHIVAFHLLVPKSEIVHLSVDSYNCTVTSIPRMHISVVPFASETSFTFFYASQYKFHA